MTRKTKSETTPAQELLAFAKDAAARCRTWSELSNLIYGIGGALSRFFPDQSSRTQFAGTPEAKEINRLICELGDDAEEPLPAASGKLLVRLPESIHAALIKEAAAEGVSLNQLIGSKLALQLRELAR